MKNIIKVLIITLTSVFAFSCTEHLELEPVSNISNATFWKTEDDATGAVYGMYDRFRVVADNTSLLYWGEGRSEIMGWSFGTGPNIYWENLLDANNSGADWNSLYTILHHANLIIKNVPDIQFSEEANKNNILAQAYAMRAYTYFWITRIWGDAILITEPTEDFSPESIQKERQPEEEVFALIKSDLETSISLFSDNEIPNGRFVWSKPAVNTLKADVFLWTAKKLNGGSGDLNTALTALNEVENADVALLNDYNSIFDYENKGNQEILFAIRFQEFEPGENWGRESYMANGYVPSNLTEASKEAIGTMGTVGGNFTVSDLVRNQFHENDQRGNGATYKDVYTVEEPGDSLFYTTFCSKYDGTVSGGVRLFVDDIVIYRYADVLLLKAEIKNALGEDPSEEINLIRQRAYGEDFEDFVFVSGSQAYNDEVILQERLFEFAFEGKRWFDLVRFDKAFDLVPSLQDRKGQDDLLLFPISENVLSLEPKVVQNPGY